MSGDDHPEIEVGDIYGSTMLDSVSLEHRHSREGYVLVETWSSSNRHVCFGHVDYGNLRAVLQIHLWIVSLRY